MTNTTHTSEPTHYEPDITPSANSPMQLALMRFLLEVRRHGVTSHALVKAFESTLRPYFLPKTYATLAYEDGILPISSGQIIESPFTIAYQLNILHVEPHHRVLEIGTGTGFSTALLSKLAKRIYSLERSQKLYAWAKRTLNEQTYPNVTTLLADGYEGFPAQAPFDRILVHAYLEKIPDHLIDQLANNGKMLIPIGTPKGKQMLWLISKENDTVIQKPLMMARFSPLYRGLMKLF